SARRHGRRGGPPVPRLALERVFTLTAAAGAVAEPDAVRPLEAAGARVVALPARREPLREALEKGDFDLLHLVCQGPRGGRPASAAPGLALGGGAVRIVGLAARAAGRGAAARGGGAPRRGAGP